MSALEGPGLVHCNQFVKVNHLNFHICALSHGREVVELFRRDELLDWGEFEATFGPVLRDGVEDGPATTVFQRGDVLGDQQWEDFRKRVIEHVSVHIVSLGIFSLLSSCLIGCGTNTCLLYPKAYAACHCNDHTLPSKWQSCNFFSFATCYFDHAKFIFVQHT